METIVKKSSETSSTSQDNSDVNTISRALANDFKIELSDFKKRLVTIPAAALFNTIKITWKLKRFKRKNWADDDEDVDEIDKSALLCRLSNKLNLKIKK